MWFIAYIGLMRPGLVLGELLVVLMCGVLFLGGSLGGRFAGSRGGLRAGLGVGAISAAVNLLVIGSLFARSDPAQPDRIDPASAALWLTALIGVSLVSAGIGGVAGSRRPAEPSRLEWPGLFAGVAAAATFLLLITGGLVTSLRAGLAVPDWPNSFGHNMLLYPLSEMKGGIYYEHAHRLFGMLVGLTSIVLAALVFLVDRRGWLRALVIGILLLVVAQGVMGGLRVTGHLTSSQEVADVRPSTAFAIVHGVLGQVVFSLFCVVAVAMSRTWRVAADLPRPRRGAALAAVTIATLLLHLYLGATFRQERTWAGYVHDDAVRRVAERIAASHGDGRPTPSDIAEAISEVPAIDATAAAPAWALHGHLTLSLVVIGLVIALAVKAIGYGAAASGAGRLTAERRVAGLGRSLLGILSLQVLLGVAALVVVLVWRSPPLPALGVAATTAHQAVGALLLAHVAMVAAWLWSTRTGRT